MIRIAVYVLLTVAFLASSSCLFSRNVPLPAGTLIRCTVDEPNFSARTANIGDPVVCYARPLVEFGCSAFPPGTQLGGEFMAYHKPGRFVGKGWMDLEFDRLILPIGETAIRARVISVSGFKVDRKGRIVGHGHPLRDAAGWMIPVLWPVKILTLPMRGPEPALRGERAMTLRLLDDVTMPCEGFENGLTGSVWNPFNGSNRITPYAGVTKILPFRTVEKQSARAFARWKGKSPSDDAAASAAALQARFRAPASQGEK
jgi:hypothetical protein